MKLKTLYSLLILLLFVSCSRNMTQEDIVVEEIEEIPEVSFQPVEDHSFISQTQPIEQVEEGEFVDKVFFSYDSSILSASARQSLLKTAIWLKQNKKKKFSISGHCDERGTKEYNLALGEQRAVTVRNFLKRNGVNVKKVKVISYGEEKPIAFGSNEISYSKNRRAEISIH